MVLDKEILTRVMRLMEGADLVTSLTERLDHSDFASLLTIVAGLRAAKVNPANLMRQYRTDRLVVPSKIPQRGMRTIDECLFDVLPEDFQTIELSPVVPFAVNAALSRVSQKTVLSTIRALEVIADPTTALALESAIQRKAVLAADPKSSKRVNLATSHRILRLQLFDPSSGFTPHFRAFALVTAGRDVGHESFERETLYDHITFYLKALERLCAKGYMASGLEVTISTTKLIEHIIQKFDLGRGMFTESTQRPERHPFRELKIDIPGKAKNLYELDDSVLQRYAVKEIVDHLKRVAETLLTEIRRIFPKVSFVFDLERVAGIGYYSDICFKITAENAMGQRYPLVDGGFSEWTQQLLSSKKERLLTSGFGTELFMTFFGPHANK